MLDVPSHSDSENVQALIAFPSGRPSKKIAAIVAGGYTRLRFSLTSCAMTSMESRGSVSQWLVELKSGDDRAAAELWNRYFERLMTAARFHLGNCQRIVDEEDVAACALASFFRRAQAGHYPDLRDRHELWQLLLTIAEHKAISNIRRERRLKRGGGNVRAVSELQRRSWSTQNLAMQNVAATEPSPELAAELADSLRRLLSALDDELRQIALAKLAGYTNEEISRQIERSLPTVERRLKLIRATWKRECET